MEELVTNLHMHTVYSDGRGTHADLAQAAVKAGLDVIFVTDHNIYVSGLEGYHQDGVHRTLVLIGEEIHDRTSLTQRNHLLVLGANRELSHLGGKPQILIQTAQAANGVTFIAHPNEDALPMFNEPEIPWDNWEVEGYTGIELWNGFSELKSVITGRLSALFFALFPRYIARGPHPENLRLWDRLLASGKRVVAVGGSDAHALRMHMGLIQRTVFPYEFHFSAVNTHLWTPRGLNGDIQADKRMIFDALRRGNAFIGYDLPASTRGFRFTAQGKEETAIAGDAIQMNGSVTLQIKLPLICECRLLKDGQVIKVWENRDICAFSANQPGVYRVECYINFLGRRRGWIFSNPIYLQRRNAWQEVSRYAE